MKLLYNLFLVVTIYKSDHLTNFEQYKGSFVQDFRSIVQKHHF